jgi:methionyl-tRNA formyltransferase
MVYSSVLVLSDNEVIIQGLIDILRARPELTKGRQFHFAHAPHNSPLAGKTVGGYKVDPLDVKKDYHKAIDNYDLVISAHCKQIFPAELIKEVKCINLHPGYNPYNRGWYPQVFSIINGLPLGATLHEIDEQLDHGGIIDREKIAVTASDTSKTAYDRVQQLELKLLERNLQNILQGEYEVSKPEKEGNLNLKKDFEKLCNVDLDKTVSFKEAIDQLRALSHPPHKNGYFIDPATGKRIWLELRLEEEQ